MSRRSAVRAMTLARTAAVASLAGGALVGGAWLRYDRSRTRAAGRLEELDAVETRGHRRCGRRPDHRGVSVPNVHVRTRCISSSRRHRIHSGPDGPRSRRGARDQGSHGDSAGDRAAPSSAGRAVLARTGRRAGPGRERPRTGARARQRLRAPGGPSDARPRRARARRSSPRSDWRAAPARPPGPRVPGHCHHRGAPPPVAPLGDADVAEASGYRVTATIAAPRPPWAPLGDADVAEAIGELQRRRPARVAVSGHDSTPSAMQRFADAFGPGFREVLVGEEIRIGPAPVVETS